MVLRVKVSVVAKQSECKLAEAALCKVAVHLTSRQLGSDPTGAVICTHLVRHDQQDSTLLDTHVATPCT